MSLRKHLLKTFALAAVCGLVGLTGCQTTSNCPDLQTVPANRVRNASCCDSGESEKINFLTLRRTPPDDYVLDGGDTLGIYIQGITGDKDTPPPVFFPDQSGLQPALGYPVPIRDDGYISLPLIEPIRLQGLTLGQAEARIREAYTDDKEILKEGSDKIIVTLMKRRTYNVLVIREDLNDSRQFLRRNDDQFLDRESQGQTFSIELPAYENDVLHALSLTGGMPGEGAFNEILVVRGGMFEEDSWDEDDDEGIVEAVGIEAEAARLRDANITRIPIESKNGQFPELSEAEITLNDGDVLYIEGRQRDVFYTGGLLSGGRFPIPRDYEIDVLEAIALSGGSEATTAGGGGSGGRIGNIVPASKITIIRRSDCKTCAISVDGKCALGDPSQRVIIQPGDLILLEYTERELWINSVTSFLTFSGIFRLIR